MPRANNLCPICGCSLSELMWADVNGTRVCDDDCGAALLAQRGQLPPIDLGCPYCGGILRPGVGRCTCMACKRTWTRPFLQSFARRMRRGDQRSAAMEWAAEYAQQEAREEQQHG